MIRLPSAEQTRSACQHGQARQDLLLIYVHTDCAYELHAVHIHCSEARAASDSVRLRSTGLHAAILALLACPLSSCMSAYAFLGPLAHLNAAEHTQHILGHAGAGSSPVSVKAEPPAEPSAVQTDELGQPLVKKKRKKDKERKHDAGNEAAGGSPKPFMQAVYPTVVAAEPVAIASQPWQSGWCLAHT